MSLTKVQMIQIIIKQENLTVEQVQERFGFSPAKAAQAVKKAHNEIAISQTESVFEKQALERVQKWIKQGKPLDHMSRVPLELVGDIKVAKRHGLLP